MSVFLGYFSFRSRNALIPGYLFLPFWRTSSLGRFAKIRRQSDMRLFSFFFFGSGCREGGWPMFWFHPRFFESSTNRSRPSLFLAASPLEALHQFIALLLISFERLHEIRWRLTRPFLNSHSSPLDSGAVPLH